ncbi:MAG TPA: SGNH/GDSL hydrolase family protein [Anaerolineales bacterium]|nr:SGNH/GDSL hydrolase family protein [Anaerolineales bacterium]
MDGRFLRNVLLKGLLLFLAVDLIFVAINPDGLGKLSLYNRLFPGRLRFPFGEDPAQSYNLSLFNIDAMFDSHVIAAGPKPADEFRVIVVGDSSTWGTLLRPQETLAGQLNAMGLSLCGKTVRVYNLGYPTISLTKDLMVLDYAMRYQPDLVIWPVTLEAFPADKQLTSPIVANNASIVDGLIAKYGLSFSPNDPALVKQNFWDRTIIGQRRPLADLFRLQMYGVLWAATGIDQTYPADYERAQTDYNTDVSFHGMLPPNLDQSNLAFDVLAAGMKAAGSTPVLLVNEPMLISSGTNSNLHYNFFYPRWAYDEYRQLMTRAAQSNGWNYLDLWNLVPADQFTNSAIHLTPAGEAMLAAQVKQSIQQLSCKK